MSARLSRHVDTPGFVHGANMSERTLDHGPMSIPAARIGAWSHTQMPFATCFGCLALDASLIWWWNNITR
jgi:hypothetical protein